MLGTTGALPLWDTGPYSGVSSQVEAVVDEFGPSDLTATTDWPPNSAAMVSQSERFADRLRSAGVSVQLVLVDRGRHGLETPGEVPSAPTISSMVTAYLERQLGR